MWMFETCFNNYVFMGSNNSEIYAVHFINQSKKQVLACFQIAASCKIMVYSFVA